MEDKSWGKCFVCDGEVLKSEGDAVSVGMKGLQGLKEASLQRKDEKVKKLAWLTTLVMHASCRKEYTRKTSIEAYLKKSEEKSSERKNEPSTSGSVFISTPQSFDMKEQCLYCCETIDDIYLKKQRKLEIQKRRQVYTVRTLGMKNHIIEAVDRRNDEWARQVSK